MQGNYSDHYTTNSAKPYFTRPKYQLKCVFYYFIICNNIQHNTHKTLNRDTIPIVTLVNTTKRTSLALAVQSLSKSFEYKV